jgi:glycosyltransferase involved in cell wall biosynthesis
LFLANCLPTRGELLHFTWGDAIVAATRRPNRCIFTLHQPYEHWSQSVWQNIGKSAGIICMAERECLEIRCRYAQVPCTFIPHGIDLDFWQPLPDPPKRQICAVGQYMRNFEMMLRVAQTLLDLHPDVIFRWVVNPDFKVSGALKAQLPRERFEILQDLSALELHRLYAESWLFCTPYHNVVASNAIVESMASGTPIFTTRVGGMSSYAGDGIITMVENNDDDALVKAVTRCLASPELRSELSSRGRQHAEKYFGWPTVVANHQAYYTKVLAGMRDGLGKH